MLNVRKSIDGSGRRGVEESRLAKFQEEPETYGPGLHCTYLDTSGRNIEELMSSDWNQMFIFTLASESKAIASEARDPQRFAKVDWLDLARERVYRVLLEVARAIPQPGETKKQALARLMQRYDAILDRAKNTFSRSAVSRLIMVDNVC